MEWAEDKQEHYKYCYNATNKAPGKLKIVWGAAVFVGVSFYKEIIHDLILRKGTPDIEDVEANLIGVKDAILGKESKF